ncbi:sensor histidine kinase [Ornithinimicrobium cavernae]|uniref:sensor histidine kinase n=1 Tax=Ornithinimicrobium cavernae TaxID=2666047 RepID=UPI000D68DEB6|nr:sensor histidine kinase [Ornithinimicrobium cavernae]
MRIRPKDLLWVLPLTLFTGVGTIFSSALPEGGWRGARSRQGDPGGPWGGETPFPDLLDAGLLLAVAIAVVASLVQLGARSRPGTTLLVTGGLVGAYLALGFHDGPIYLVLVVSSFVSACHAPLRTWARCVTAALLAVLAGLVVRDLVGSSDGGTLSALWQASGTVGLTLAAGLLGGLLRNRRQAARERARHAATAEQLRTAQELHDGVGHGLAVIAMQSGVALHLLDRDPVAARAALEAIRDTSRESLGSLRVELSRLSGQEAPRRPRPGLADLATLVGRVEAAGVAVAVHDESPSDVPEQIGAAIYAIAQEALTNVLRHSGAQRVQVALTPEDGTLRLVVRDDGSGPTGQDDSVGDDGRRGMGLAGMHDRAAALGGTLSAGPRPGGGFEVVAVLPLRHP